MKRYEKVPPGAARCFCSSLVEHDVLHLCPLPSILCFSDEETCELQKRQPRQTAEAATTEPLLREQNAESAMQFAHTRTHTHTGDRTLLIIPLSGPQSHANILIQLQIFGVLWSIAGVSCWPVQLMQCREDTENISLCLFAVSDVLPGFLIRMPKPSRAGTDCVSFLRMG